MEGRRQYWNLFFLFFFLTEYLAYRCQGKHPWPLTTITEDLRNPWVRLSCWAGMIVSLLVTGRKILFTSCIPQWRNRVMGPFQCLYVPCDCQSRFFTWTTVKLKVRAREEGWFKSLWTGWSRVRAVSSVNNVIGRMRSFMPCWTLTRCLQNTAWRGPKTEPTGWSCNSRETTSGIL